MSQRPEHTAMIATGQNAWSSSRDGTRSHTRDSDREYPPVTGCGTTMRNCDHGFQEFTYVVFHVRSSEYMCGDVTFVSRGGTSRRGCRVRTHAHWQQRGGTL